MTTHGGSRTGAGRKSGGANKIDQEARAAALESGQSPLDFMLEVMRDRKEERARRLDAAKAAAPYMHARLTAMELTGADGGPIEHDVNQRLPEAAQRVFDGLTGRAEVGSPALPVSD